MLHLFTDHIRRFVPLSAAEQELVLEHVTLKHASKKEYILKEGEVCIADHFILKGCFRMYFVKENGQEQTTQFGIENWWITDHTSLARRKPSVFYIQAVEDSDIAMLTAKNRDILLGKIPQLESYFRQIYQRMLAATQYRTMFYYDMSAEERYNHINDAYPEFVQRVPQYMLASYLGFSPEVLSRIRAKK